MPDRLVDFFGSVLGLFASVDWEACLKSASVFDLSIYSVARKIPICLRFSHISLFYEFR